MIIKVQSRGSVPLYSPSKVEWKQIITLVQIPCCPRAWELLWEYLIIYAFIWHHFLFSAHQYEYEGMHRNKLKSYYIAASLMFGHSDLIWLVLRAKRVAYLKALNWTRNSWMSSKDKKNPKNNKSLTKPALVKELMSNCKSDKLNAIMRKKNLLPSL